MIKYILIGLMWAIFLEFLTSKETFDSPKIDWTNRERVVQVFIWPVSMVIFIVEFLRNIWK